MTIDPATSSPCPAIKAARLKTNRDGDLAVAVPVEDFFKKRAVEARRRAAAGD